MTAAATSLLPRDRYRIFRVRASCVRFAVPLALLRDKPYTFCRCAPCARQAELGRWRSEPRRAWRGTLSKSFCFAYRAPQPVPTRSLYCGTSRTFYRNVRSDRREAARFGLARGRRNTFRALWRGARPPVSARIARCDTPGRFYFRVLRATPAWATWTSDTRDNRRVLRWRAARAVPLALGLPASALVESASPSVQVSA